MLFQYILVLLEIDRKTDWLYEFRVTNTILMSKVKGLSISALQRARNELINNNIFFIKKEQIKMLHLHIR